MKRFIFLITLYLTGSINLIAGVTPELYLPQQDFRCSQFVDIPVRVVYFNNIISMQGTVLWDVNSLQFQSIINYGSSEVGLKEGDFGLTELSKGNLTFSWYDLSFNGVTISDNSDLFVIRFIKVPLAKKTNVTIGKTPLAPEFTNSQFETFFPAESTQSYELVPTIPSFTQIAPICKGESFILPTTSNNNITGNWSPAINPQSTTTYTFTPTEGQCADATTMKVSIRTPVAEISGNNIDDDCDGLVDNVYKFIGSGNFSNPANWEGESKPVNPLPANYKVFIMPQENGSCILDVQYNVLKGAQFIVSEGKKLLVPGNLIIE